MDQNKNKLVQNSKAHKITKPFATIKVALLLATSYSVYKTGTLTAKEIVLH